MGSTFGEIFVTGGWVMWPLLAFSILTVAIVLERTWVFLRVRPELKSLGQSIIESVKDSGVDNAKQICHSQNTHVSQLYLGTLEHKVSRESCERITERNRVRLRTYLKKNLWILGTIGSSSPFIGLLGTVMGILDAFNDMAEKGVGGFSVVAGGISEALIATAAGLIVAIIALLSYNVFTTLANQTVTDTKLDLDELIDFSFPKTQTAN